MALYKIVPKNPYYFWSVMSLVMQVRSHACASLRAFRSPATEGRIFNVQAISADDEKLAQTMFLPLAERMVEKMVKEEKIEAEAEVSVALPHRLRPCCHVVRLLSLMALSRGDILGGGA